MLQPMKLTIRGQRRNGLPVRTMICVVIVLNMARHNRGHYVEDGLKRLARDMAEQQWGGSREVLLHVRMRNPWKTMIPVGEDLS